jgi:hypothetical protein
MKLSIIFTLAIAGLATASIHLLPRGNPIEARDSCSDPAPNTCTFYPNCLESKYHCGRTGYPIGYGLHYCTLFTAAAKSMSSRGKTWVTDTMLCLQRALVPFATGAQSTTCPALKNYAFGTHPDCYVKSGVCLLPPSDWLIIVKTVSLKELFNSWDALKATLDTVKDCGAFYAWLLKQGIIKVVDGVVDWAESLWDIITGWF